jgi:hypothetical protein
VHKDLVELTGGVLIFSTPGRQQFVRRRLTREGPGFRLSGIFKNLKRSRSPANEAK